MSFLLLSFFFKDVPTGVVNWTARAGGGRGLERTDLGTCVNIFTTNDWRASEQSNGGLFLFFSFFPRFSISISFLAFPPPSSLFLVLFFFSLRENQKEKKQEEEKWENEKIVSGYK